MEHAGAYIFTWLAGYGSLLGAIAGVMIADYWWWRKRRLSLQDLYRGNGQYGHWNVTAFVALVIAIIPLLPGFLAAAATPGGIIPHPDLLDQLYTYGWLFTFAASSIAYVSLRLAQRLINRGVDG